MEICTFNNEFKSSYSTDEYDNSSVSPVMWDIEHLNKKRYSPRILKRKHSYDELCDKFENETLKKRKNSFTFDLSLNTDSYSSEKKKKVTCDNNIIVKNKYYDDSNDDKPIKFLNKKMELRVNHLISKLLINNYYNYLPNNEVLLKYLTIQEKVGIKHISLKITEYLFSDYELMNINDFNVFSYFIRNKEKINHSMVESFKYNNIKFINNMYSTYFSNVDNFIAFLLENTQIICLSCKIHSQVNDWLVAKLNYIIENTEYNTCKELLKFLNAFANEELYIAVIKKYPQLIEEQLNIPVIKNAIDQCIMAINAGVLGFHVDNDSFQILPYSVNPDENNEDQDNQENNEGQDN